MSSNKLCFTELHLIYQNVINLTYYVFITNDYIYSFKYPFSNRIFLLEYRLRFYLNKDATDVF